MAMFTKLRDELRSDEPGPADHHNLHAAASLFDRSVDAIGPTHQDRPPPRFVTPAGDVLDDEEAERAGAGPLPREP
jgi:hypothetical protein